MVMMMIVVHLIFLVIIPNSFAVNPLEGIKTFSQEQGFFLFQRTLLLLYRMWRMTSGLCSGGEGCPCRC